MRIDLHTHSNVSDGTDTPRELVLKACKAGIDAMALTDHDTTQGWAEATSAAEQAGLRLIRGIELSTDNDGHGQHLLAYEPDPADAGLVAMLERLDESRRTRVPSMVELIRQQGIDISLTQVQKIAGNGTIGRPHIATALVKAGACKTEREAWKPFLLPDSPTYVARYKLDIEEAIRTVAGAGGVTVVAHPWGRKTHVSEDRFAELKVAGLVGIEVDHQEHDRTARDALSAIARNLGLIITGSSDHHGTRKRDHDLGCNTTDPEQFERLISSAPAAIKRGAGG